MHSTIFSTNSRPVFFYHRDCEDRRKQHSDSLSGSTTWLVAPTVQCSVISLTLLPKQPFHKQRTQEPGRSSNTRRRKKLKKQIMEKDKINVSTLAVMIMESSTSTLHQPLKHTYVCTLRKKKGGGRIKSPCYHYILSFCNLYL